MTISAARGLCSHLNVLLVRAAQSRAAVCFIVVVSPISTVASDARYACNTATEACIPSGSTFWRRTSMDGNQTRGELGPSAR